MMANGIANGASDHAMTVLEFIASLVGSLAWPLAAVLIAALFRSQISALMRKLRTLSFGSAQADFSEKLDQLEVESEAAVPAQGDVPEAPDLSARFQQLLAVSPAAAILDSWREIEDEVARIAVRRGISTDVRNMRKLMAAFVGQGILDPGAAHMFEDLRGLRNVAAHRSEQEITASDAIRFQELANRALARLGAIQ